MYETEEEEARRFGIFRSTLDRVERKNREHVHAGGDEVRVCCGCLVCAPSVGFGWLSSSVRGDVWFDCAPTRACTHVHYTHTHTHTRARAHTRTGTDGRSLG